MFWNRKEDLWLYQIFKLLILLFGFITMFDTGTTMFLLSYDTDYIGWNTRLNAVYTKGYEGESRRWAKSNYVI